MRQMSTSRVLGGRYGSGEVIGRGGTANVHLANDLRSGRWVAIKMLRKELSQDPLVLSRFRREAQLVAGLRHPAIVTFLDTGCEEVEGDSADRISIRSSSWTRSTGLVGDGDGPGPWGPPWCSRSGSVLRSSTPACPGASPVGESLSTDCGPGRPGCYLGLRPTVLTIIRRGEPR